MGMQLFEEIAIGGLQLRNRVLRSATLEYMGSEDGSVTPLMEKVYEELASNEVGLIVTCALYVTESGKLSKIQSGMEQDIRIQQWNPIVEKVHNHGGKIMAQIHHAGSRSITNAVSVSEMSSESLMELEQAFVQAAIRAKKAGMDGVQIHCAHRYLIAGLLSTEENRRNDNYGGSVENRCRLVKNIVVGIREACGKDYPIWVKLDSNNCSDKEHPRDDLAEIGKQLESYGVNAIEVSGCNQSEMRDDVHLYYLEGAKILKSAVSIPIILTGGIRTMEEALEVLDAHIEMIGMSRPFICEPDLLKKWKNQEKQSAKCISCGICRSLYGRRGKRCAFHGKKYEEM